MGSDDPILRFPNQTAFETWLEANHGDAAGIWLQIAKRGATDTTISYEEAVDAALCFGWIDGQKARGDARVWLQRFTRRTRRSRWSRINRDRAERLVAEGRMREAGLDAIASARSDGRWDAAYEGQRTAGVPDDLQRALAADPDAAAAFESLDARNRYAIVWRLNDAKRPETRTRRLEKFLEMLRRGETIH